MLRDFVENKHCLFLESVKDWKEALRMSIKTLVADKSVEEVYGEQIIDSVEKYGPYIVLMPGIAMPHSQEGAIGVNKTTIGFMKVKEKVVFDENDSDSYANLFFTLASCNHDEHLSNMSKLAVMLTNDELVAELHNANCEADLLRIADKYL